MSTVRPLWHLPGALGEQLFAIGPDLTVGGHMPVKSLPSDVDFSAQLGHLGLGLAHCGLGEAQLGGCPFGWTPAVSATRAGRGQAGAGTFHDQLALGSDEAREDQVVFGDGDVDRRALARPHLEADAVPRQDANRVDVAAVVAMVDRPARLRVAEPRRHGSHHSARYSLDHRSERRMRSKMQNLFASAG